MNVSSLMTTSPITCRPDEPLSIAAERMWSHDCGVLPVVDGSGNVIAMITDRDICMAAWTRGRALHEITVSGAMSKIVHSVRATDPLAAAMDAMRSHEVRRLPVTANGGRLVGLLTLGDLARAAMRGTDSMTAEGVTATMARIVEPPRKKTEKAADGPSALRRRLDELRTLRDSIRVRLHLAKMDARDSFREIEPKIEKLERQIREIGEDATEKLTGALEKLEKSLRSIDEAMTPRSGSASSSRGASSAAHRRSPPERSGRSASRRSPKS
jgi:CBS domain-containing protein